MWDDATTRIAHHRLHHNTPDTEPGIGARPADTIAACEWQLLMIRLLQDRLWLTNQPTPTPQPLACATPSELLQRQHDLKQLLASAPTDQRQFIDRIVNSALAPTQMHNYLTSVASGQEARRDWIIANWPHIVELEQVTQVIATRQTQPHWPAAQPDPVKTVLDQLRHYAPDVTERENRSLAQLARHQIEHDPVGRLEARHRDLQQLNQHTLSPTEHEALHIELVNNSNEIRAARRAHAAEQAFERYTPNPTDDARTTRITTLAHDTLTTPTWVINHIRHLHDHHLLADTDTAELATRIITTAAHLDIHGQLPPAWDAPPAPTVHGTQPGIEVG